MQINDAAIAALEAILGIDTHENINKVPILKSHWTTATTDAHSQLLEVSDEVQIVAR